MTTYDMSLASSALLLLAVYIAIEAIRLALLGRRAVSAGKRAPRASSTPLLSRCSVLVIGDSTALGTGATRAEYTLVGRLAQQIPDATIVNAAQNAMTLATLEKCLNDRSLEQYDFVIIHIGGIDTISLTPQYIIHHRLERALQAAQKIARSKVILISVNNAGASPFFHFPLNVLMDARSAHVSKISHTVATRNNVLHIPLYTKKSEDPLHKNQKRFFSADGIHPNDEGYGLWYEIIKPTLVPIITKSV